MIFPARRAFPESLANILARARRSCLDTVLGDGGPGSFPERFSGGSDLDQGGWKAVRDERSWLSSTEISLAPNGAFKAALAPSRN